MQIWIVFAAIVILSLAFVMWLAMFALSRGMNSNLETDAESRRIASRQIVFGALLLGSAVALSVYFFKMDRPEIIPELGPGLTTKAPMVKEKLEKKSGSKAETPKSAEPVSPAPPESAVGETEKGKQLPNPAVI